MEEEFRFTIADVGLAGVVLLRPAGWRLELISRTGARAGMQADHPNTAALTFGFSHFRTDLLAFVPDALARRCENELSLRVVETPLELPPLVESAHWHAVNIQESGLGWLLDVIAELQRLPQSTPTA